jgi:hypothetical protein
MAQLPRRPTNPRGIPSMTFYEIDNRYTYYREASSYPIATFERERQALEAARKYALALGHALVRVVFVIPTKPGE